MTDQKTTWRDGVSRPGIARADMNAILAAIDFVLCVEDPFNDHGATVERLKQFKRRIVEWRGEAGAGAAATVAE
jgi:hypothetical protein